jgi:hypothetical protein
VVRRRLLILTIAIAPGLLAFGLLYFLPAQPGGARLLVEEWPGCKTETLEWRDIVFQVADGDARMVEVLSAFPPTPKDDMHVVLNRQGQPVSVTRLIRRDEKTGGELTPASIGINTESNIWMNRMLYGLADGELRLWPEHVRHLGATGQIPARPRRQNPPATAPIR